MSHALHHITAISGNAQANYDFYTGVLGLRLVKQTINHNDPNTLHLFYGDAAGTPGTLLTFFIWEGANSGRLGHGAVAEVGLQVAQQDLGRWVQRFTEKGVAYTFQTPDDSEAQLLITDPDGLALRLVGQAHAAPSREGELGVLGLEHAVIWTETPAVTQQILENTLGFQRQKDLLMNEATLQHYQTAAKLGNSIYLRDVTGFWSAAVGAGSVHHLAFRARTEPEAQRILAAAQAQQFETSELQEHGYFQSVYFREPDGLRFEVATDGPGLTYDEAPGHLGELLVLPSALEASRPKIAAALPPLFKQGDSHPMTTPLEFTHRYLPGTVDTTLLLLHGTGGNETSLLGWAREVAPEANLLSVRGRALDEGFPRFFRRFDALHYDQENIREEAAALAAFLGRAADVYGFRRDKVTALGYSNGANIAIAMLALHPKSLAGAALLRPVMPLDEVPNVSLKGVPVLVLQGAHDPFAPYGQRVLDFFSAAEAELLTHTLEAGHELTAEDSALVKAWLGPQPEA